MCHAIARGKRSGFFVSERCHPQTIAVIETRANAIGIDIVVGDHETFDFDAGDTMERAHALGEEVADHLLSQGARDLIREAEVEAMRSQLTSN